MNRHNEDNSDSIPTVASLLTPEQVADALGTTTKTLANWRSRNTGPAYVRVAGRVFYSKAEFRRYWDTLMGGAA